MAIYLLFLCALVAIFNTGSGGILNPNYFDWHKLENLDGYKFSPEEIKKYKIWPRGVIPYMIDKLSFGDRFTKILIEWLRVAHQVLGVRFIHLNEVPSGDERWVLFINRRGQLQCEDKPYSEFTASGVQHVVVGYDCSADLDSLLPTLLSLLGVPPQHNAPNRDENIKVHDENILQDKKKLFQVLTKDEWPFKQDDTNIKGYDYLSAGHYGTHKYSANGKATITFYDKNFTNSEHNGISKMDLTKIRTLYNDEIKKKDKDTTNCPKIFNYYQGNHKLAKQKPMVLDGTPDNINGYHVKDEPVIKLKKKGRQLLSSDNGLQKKIEIEEMADFSSETD